MSAIIAQNNIPKPERFKVQTYIFDLNMLRCGKSLLYIYTLLIVEKVSKIFVTFIDR